MFSLSDGQQVYVENKIGGAPTGRIGVVDSRGPAPLSPMAKSVQRIRKPRITTAVPARANRDRSLERSTKNPRCLTQRLCQRLCRGWAALRSMQTKRWACSANHHRAPIGCDPGEHEVWKGRRGRSRPGVRHQPAARNFTAHLSATRQFHATVACIPNDVALLLPEKSGLAPCGYWFNQLQRFGEVGKWSTKARDDPWKTVHLTLFDSESHWAAPPKAVISN
jgi:hypothetical protein